MARASRRPMAEKLTILHTETSRGWGGQEIRILGEMRAMRERGHRVALAAPADATIHRRALADGFEVFSFSDGKLSYPRSILGLVQVCRRLKPQVVNPHSSRDGWIAGIAARLARVPMLVRSRHIEVDYPNRWLSRLAFGRLPHHVITTSDRISGRLIQELQVEPSRVTCVPTGVDLRRFHPGVPGGLRAELGIPDGVLLIGVVAVLRSWKGHGYLLEALSLLVKGGIRARLAIAGDGPARAYVNQRIAELGLREDVHCLGHREDVPGLLASMDVVALASTAHEGVPQVVLQAQAMAKAVVGTRVGGIPEVIEDGVTGLLVPPCDPKALAAALSRLLADSGLRERLGASARRRVESQNSVDAMCSHLERIYATRLHPSA